MTKHMTEMEKQLGDGVESSFNHHFTLFIVHLLVVLQLAHHVYC